MMDRQVPIAILLIALVSLSRAASVPFETVERGQHSAIGYSVERVFRTLRDFETFWTKHTSNRYPPPPAPDVDFASQMVVAVFAGVKPGGGYGIEVASVEETVDDGGKELVVNSVTTSPPSWGMTSQALTQPYHIISLEASDDGVAFVTREEPTPPRPFPTFILLLGEDADKDGIASYIETLPAVENVQVLSAVSMIFVNFDSNEIGREEARMLLEGINGVEEVEEDPPAPDETVLQG